MTREPDRPADSPATLDDDQLAALVRAGVEDWRLPPQRLDQPTWRDRVDARGTGRRRGWFARLAGPVGAAVLGHGRRRVRRGVADVAAIERSDRRSVADGGRRVVDFGRGLAERVAESSGTSRHRGPARPAGQRRPARSVSGDGPIGRDVSARRSVDGNARTGVRRHIRRPADDAGSSVRWLGLHLYRTGRRRAAGAGSS